MKYGQTSVLAEHMRWKQKTVRLTSFFFFLSLSVHPPCRQGVMYSLFLSMRTNGYHNSHVRREKGLAMLD